MHRSTGYARPTHPRCRDPRDIPRGPWLRRPVLVPCLLRGQEPRSCSRAEGHPAHLCGARVHRSSTSRWLERARGDHRHGAGHARKSRTWRPLRQSMSLRVTRSPLWLRIAMTLPLLLGVFALVGLPQVLGEGSANLEANGGKRALTEWRTSLYGNLLPRRTLFNVYAKAGEEIALGSSGVGVGAGDIVVWTPGQITAPLTVALPAPDFTCSMSQPGAGAMTTRAEEVAGPLPAARRLHTVYLHGGHDGDLQRRLLRPVGRQQRRRWDGWHHRRARHRCDPGQRRVDVGHHGPSHRGSEHADQRAGLHRLPRPDHRRQRRGRTRSSRPCGP